MPDTTGGLVFQARGVSKFFPGVKALEGTVSEPAWRKKPSWYLVATDDHMIPPPAQQMMAKRAGATIVESKGSHAIYVSRPETVASIIKSAART